MTLLDQIIDGSTDDTVSTANLLRLVQTAATRMGAQDVVEWARSELNGYSAGDASFLPKYRARQPFPVKGLFTGWGGSRVTTLLSPHGTPAAMADKWFSAEFRQPLSELEKLAATTGDNTPSISWPPHVAVRYRKLAGEGKVLYMEDMDLFAAEIQIPVNTLASIVELVRNKALEFALDLQRVNPDAGSAGGPTVADPAVAQTVYTIINNITGNGTNIAAGSQIKQRSRVAVNDLESLRAAAEGLGLSTEDANEFAAIVTEERSVTGSKLTRFMRKVRSGSISLGTNITGNMAATGLLDLAEEFLKAIT